VRSSSTSALLAWPAISTGTSALPAPTLSSVPLGGWMNFIQGSKTALGRPDCLTMDKSCRRPAGSEEI